MIQLEDAVIHRLDRIVLYGTIRGLFVYFKGFIWSIESFAALTNNFGTIDCSLGITDLFGMSIFA